MYMLEIIGGIFIGIGIETVFLTSYIFYKRKQLKPQISYNEVFNVNVNSDVLDSPPPQNEGNIAVEYNDL